MTTPRLRFHLSFFTFHCHPPPHRIRGGTESPSGNGQALEISVVVAAAKIDRRPAMRLLKHSGEVLDCGEAALGGNIADRQIGMVQQGLRILGPYSRQEFADRVAGLEVEELRQTAS